MKTRINKKPSSYDFRFANVRRRGRWIANLDRQHAGREAMTWLRALASSNVPPGRRAMALRYIEPVVRDINGGLASRWREATEPGWVPKRVAMLAVEFHLSMAEQFLRLATDSVFRRRSAYLRALVHCDDGARVCAENYMDPPDTLWPLLHRIYDAAGGASACASVQCQYRRSLVAAVTSTTHVSPRAVHALFRVLRECESLTRLVPVAVPAVQPARVPVILVDRNATGIPRLVHGAVPDGPAGHTIYDMTPLISAWMTLPARHRILSDTVARRIHDAWCDNAPLNPDVVPDAEKRYPEHLVVGLRQIIHAIGNRDGETVVGWTEGVPLTAPDRYMRWAWPANGKRLAVGMPLAHRSARGAWTVLVVRWLKRVGHSLHVGTETLRGAPSLVRIGTFGHTPMMDALQVGNGRLLDLLLPSIDGIHGLREVLVLCDKNPGYFKVVRTNHSATGGMARVSVDSGRDRNDDRFDYRAALAAI